MYQMRAFLLSFTGGIKYYNTLKIRIPHKKIVHSFYYYFFQNIQKNTDFKIYTF